MVKYNLLVEMMSVGIHDAWIRSRKTMMNRYGENTPAKSKINKATGNLMTMKEHFVPNFVPYEQLSDDTKEYDRMEARMYLAITNKIPPYVTRKERKQLKKCVQEQSKNADPSIAYQDRKNNGMMECFIKDQLFCNPSWRKEGKCPTDWR